ncbi:MAG TPA: thioredoxin family protein [Methylophilus sp.]
MSSTPFAVELTYADTRQLTGLVLLEFGATWCSYCQAAQAMITQAVAQYPHLQHIKIEDGKGKRLGRQLTVKLWPTLIVLKDGVEMSRVVRPMNVDQIMQLFSNP